MSSDGIRQDWPRPPAAVEMILSAPEPCPYLPDRWSRIRAFHAGRMSPELYHRFMDAGFRRSGRIIYRPACENCRACQPLRVPVEAFCLSKSQRRCWKRNADLSVSIDQPHFSDEKFALYERYLRQWHGREHVDGPDAFMSFLYESPVRTLEFCYRDAAGKLLAVGLCDVCNFSLSSVYYFYEPCERRRGLGTYGALYELAYAQRVGLPYYYLGYLVHGCGAMEYKASFRPYEIMDEHGVWRAGTPA